MKTKRKISRIIAMLLMVCMVVTLMPSVPAYAVVTLDDYTVRLTMPEPKAGEKPFGYEDVTINAADADKVEVTGLIWFKGDPWMVEYDMYAGHSMVGEYILRDKMQNASGNSSSPSEGENFIEGTTYYVCIKLSPKDGYVINGTTKATINGQMAEIDYYGKAPFYDKGKIPTYVVKKITIGTPKNHSVDAKISYRDDDGILQNWKKHISDLSEGEKVTIEIPFSEIGDCFRFVVLWSSIFVTFVANFFMHNVPQTE